METAVGGCVDGKRGEVPKEVNDVVSGQCVMCHNLPSISAATVRHVDTLLRRFMSYVAYRCGDVTTNTAVSVNYGILKIFVHQRNNFWHRIYNFTNKVTQLK